jgi:disulfide oxidoreductase YuzD
MVQFLKQSNLNSRDVNSYSNAIYQNVNTGYRYNESTTQGNESANTDAIATNVEDLYFYPLHHFSLKKGAKAMYPLLTQEVEIAHVFECDLKSNQDFIDRSHNYNFTPDTKNPVFHSLKMRNESNLPWTTGLAFIAKSEKGIAMPLGQDKLNFTASKGQTYLKITQTPEIQVKHSEKELERKDEGTYDLVTIESTILVKNYKNKDVNMDIRRLVYGDVLKSDLKFEREEIIIPAFNYINYTAANLCWEFAVKANKEQSIKYTYKILVYNP